MSALQAQLAELRMELERERHEGTAAAAASLASAAREQELPAAAKPAVPELPTPVSSAQTPPVEGAAA